MVSYTATIVLSVEGAEDDEFLYIADKVQEMRDYLSFEGETVTITVTSDVIEEEAVEV